MNIFFKSLIAQLREFYKNLTPTKRMSMLIAAGIVAVAVIFLVGTLMGTDYAPFLRNIPSDQTGLLVEKLQQKNIPYRILDDGKTIAVPKELIHVAQMAMMTEMGSSKIGNVGLELFDKQDFGSTSYAQRINYQRALQGELSRAISTLDAVKRAKVMLALPPKKNFLEDGGTPTASVVVELNAGKTLSEEQVRGVTFLVANAVEGMDAEKVSVIDSRGKLLTRPGDSLTSGSSQLVDLKSKIEREYAERVEQILERVVGSGKVMAKVDVSLRPQTIATVEETVDPERTAILSTQAEDEALDGSRNNPTGIPGARSNLPGGQETGQVGFNQNIKKGFNITNYAVPKTIRNIKESAGAIERVSIAVVVDGTTAIGKDDKGEETETYSPRKPEELVQYESLIKNAIGFNLQRGDQVKVENIAFQKVDFSESEKLITTLERKKLLNSLLKWILLAFALAMFFFIVIRPFMRWVTDSFQESVEDMLPKTIEELEELQSVDNTLPGMSSALPALEESLDPDKAESELLRERIMGMMANDEEKAAGAFSLWLVRRDS